LNGESPSDATRGDVDEAQDAEGANTGAAVPMGYQGPLAPDNQQQAQGNTTYDVPMAPASQAAAVGAPNASNTKVHGAFKSFDDFVGLKITKPLLNGPARSEEELERRKQWLPNFLAQGGLSTLVSLLKNLSKYHSNNQQSSVFAPRTHTNVRIVKSCLSEVMESIRILLVSSFCANSTDEGMSLSLQRKTMSSVSVEGAVMEASGTDAAADATTGAAKDEKQEDMSSAPAGEASGAASTDKSTDKDKKSKLQEEQENTEEEMKPLIELLKGRLDLDLNYQLALGLESF